MRKQNTATSSLCCKKRQTAVTAVGNTEVKVQFLGLESFCVHSVLNISAWVPFGFPASSHSKKTCTWTQLGTLNCAVTVSANVSLWPCDKLATCQGCNLTLSPRGSWEQLQHSPLPMMMEIFAAAPFLSCRWFCSESQSLRIWLLRTHAGPRQDSNDAVLLEAIMAD